MKRKIILTALCFAVLKTNLFAGFECAASGPFAQCKTAADAFNKCLKTAHPKIFQSYKADFFQGFDLFLNLEFENMARKPLANPVVKYKGEVESIADVNCLSKLKNINSYIKYIDNDPGYLDQLSMPIWSDLRKKEIAENTGIFTNEEMTARRAALEKKIQMEQQQIAQKKAQKAAQQQAFANQAAANQAVVAAQAQNQAQAVYNQQLLVQQTCDTSANGKCKTGKGAFDCLSLKNPDMFKLISQDPSQLEIKRTFETLDLQYGGDQFSSNPTKLFARFRFDDGGGSCIALLDGDRVKFSDYVDYIKNPPMTPEQKAASDARQMANLGFIYEDPNAGNRERQQKMVKEYYFGAASVPVVGAPGKVGQVPGQARQG